MRRVVSRAPAVYGNMVLCRGVFQRHSVPVPTAGATGTWVSNVYPLRSVAPVIDAVRYVLRRFGKDFTWHEDYILRDLKVLLSKSGVTPCDYFPRFKEGGVLVYFSSLEEAEKALTYFHTHKFRGKQAHVFLIEGTPWLEDMLNVKPSVKVKVTPALVKSTLPLTEEQLYTEMRVYGTLASMEFDPKQEFATFLYRSEYSAISARVCLHMKEVAPNIHIRVKYEPHSRFSWISKLMSNPRVTVPVIAIGGSILSYLLIDPFRLVNVIMKLSSNKELSAVEAAEDVPETTESEELANVLAHAPGGSGLLLVGSNASRKAAISQVTKNRWFVVSLNLNPDGRSQVADTVQDLCTQIGFFPTFNNLSRMFEYFQAMIPGTKATTAQGNAEEQLTAVLRVLTMALKIVSRTYPNDGRPFPYALVVLDFRSTMSEAGNPSVVPLVQAWANDMMRLKLAHVVVSADSHFTVMSDSTIGSLKNHSYVIHKIEDINREQLKDLLHPLFVEAEVPTIGLEEYLLLEQYGHYENFENISKLVDEDLDKVKSEQKGGLLNFVKYTFTGNEPSMAGIDNPHPLKDEEDAVEETPQPQSNAAVQEAAAAESGIWERIYQVMEKVLLRRGLDMYSRYAGQKKSDVKIPMEGLTVDTLSDLVDHKLGGRLTDVMKFKHRVLSTRNSPRLVLRDMEAECLSEIMNRGFGKKLFKEASPGPWTQVQLWKCVKAIVEAEGKARQWVPLNPLLLNVFKGDKAAFQALAQTGVLAIEETEDGDHWVTSGSPLMFHAFKAMVADKAIWKGMEKMVLDAEYTEYTTEAAKLEEAVSNLASAGVVAEMDSTGRDGLRNRKTQLTERLGELTQLIRVNRKKKASL